MVVVVVVVMLNPRRCDVDGASSQPRSLEVERSTRRISWRHDIFGV